jgi:N-methylhydantoinase B/oxoprolinase/acetone carboxylase alpha subunit
MIGKPRVTPSVHDGNAPCISYVSHDIMSQMIAMPREFLLDIDAKLVAEHELRTRNREIAMRRELRSVQKCAELTTKVDAMQQRVERRTSARIAKMLQREDVALRECQ